MRIGSGPGLLTFSSVFFQFANLATSLNPLDPDKGSSACPHLGPGFQGWGHLTGRPGVPRNFTAFR